MDGPIHVRSRVARGLRIDQSAVGFYWALSKRHAASAITWAD